MHQEPKLEQMPNCCKLHEAQAQRRWTNIVRCKMFTKNRRQYIIQALHIYKREHSESADLRQSGYGQYLDADDFQNLMGTSLSKDASVAKFSRKSDQ